MKQLLDGFCDILNNQGLGKMLSASAFGSADIDVVLNLTVLFFSVPYEMIKCCHSYVKNYILSGRTHNQQLENSSR